MGTALYLVLEGVAEILEDYGAERRVGEYVGEDAFFQSTKGLRVCRKTVAAKTDMVLGILAFDTLEAMMLVRPDLAVDVIMNVGRMVRGPASCSLPFFVRGRRDAQTGGASAGGDGARCDGRWVSERGWRASFGERGCGRLSWSEKLANLLRRRGWALEQMVQRSLNNCALDIHDPSPGVIRTGSAGAPGQLAPLDQSEPSGDGGLDRADVADDEEGYAGLVGRVVYRSLSVY